MIPDDDQKALGEAARKFSREVLLPGYLKRDKATCWDRDLAREMGGLGLLGVSLPEEVGGLGERSVTLGIVTEELGYGDYNVSQLPINVCLNASILLRSAPKHIVEEWVPQMLTGDKLMAICLTEPRGGSDAANIQLRAHRSGDDYILNGEKTSITFAGDADIFLVFARTGTVEDGAKGVTAFFVTEGTKGISRSRFDDVGSRIIGRGSLFFEDVVVPARNRVGDEGKGFTQVMQGFDYSRALLGLQACGAAQASLDEAWAYAKEREAFGRPIGQFQGVSFPLAEGESKIAAIRQLCYHTLELRDAGLEHTAQSAMCKSMGPETAFNVIHQCLLTFGHYGWTMETAHQQRMRDVMGQEIGDGTANIMKQIISRSRIGRAAIQY
ncbi:MAG: acyl-CoA dehydrogenase family protein [Rhodobiaceae bacterium]|nr:acyl-CoA dehydrogenase family protein [Rhodobiaceae bacterium]